jgi:hypothetical protein
MFLFPQGRRLCASHWSSVMAKTQPPAGRQTRRPPISRRSRAKEKRDEIPEIMAVTIKLQNEGR